MVLFPKCDLKESLQASSGKKPWNSGLACQPSIYVAIQSPTTVPGPKSDNWSSSVNHAHARSSSEPHSDRPVGSGKGLEPALSARTGSEFKARGDGGVTQAQRIHQRLVTYLVVASCLLLWMCL